MHYSMVKPYCLNFKVVTEKCLGVFFFSCFTVVQHSLDIFNKARVEFQHANGQMHRVTVQQMFAVFLYKVQTWRQ